MCVKGYHTAQDGSRFCPFILRIHLFGGKSELRIHHTFIYDQDPNTVELASIGMSFPFDLGVVERARSTKRFDDSDRTTEELRMQKSSVLVFSAGPGLVRTEMTELQANTAAGQRWIPSTRESFETGNLRRPEEISLATMKMIQVATLESSGRNYRPDTDFSDWD